MSASKQNPVLEALQALQNTAVHPEVLNYSKDTINVDVLKVLRKALYIQPGKRMKVKGSRLDNKISSCTLCYHTTNRVQSTAMKKKCVTKQPVVPRPIGQKELIMEDYVRLVSDLYYTNTPLPYGAADANNFNDKRAKSLRSLISPLRQTTPIELWSPYEVAVFESSISVIGKDFFTIAKLLPGKTTAQVIDFYYYWKTTSHYKLWKKNYKNSLIIN